MITVEYAEINTSGDNYTRVFRPHGSGSFLFICFLSPMHVNLKEGILATAPGACMIFRPDSLQDFSAVRDYRVSYFLFSMPDDEFERLELPVGEVFYPRGINLIHDQMLRLQTEFYTREPFYQEALHSLAFEILLSVSRETHAARMNEICDRQLYGLFCQARYTMLTNCDKAWNSKNMCQMVSLSRSQFYKYYDDFFSTSPMQDLTAARIEKAKMLLTNDEHSVTEISEMCGYASIHHFSRTFKEHTGLSPLAYVKSKTGLEKEE